MTQTHTYSEFVTECSLFINIELPISHQNNRSRSVHSVYTVTNEQAELGNIIQVTVF